MCFCDCFEDNWVLIAIIILMLIFLCNGGCHDDGCGNRSNGCDCGC